MPTLAIDFADAPKEIKDSLRKLSVNITFERQANKGANGYLFFGYNRVVGRHVAVKYYYYGGKDSYHAEPQQLAKVQCRAVISIYDAALVNGHWAYFVTPYCRNGDLDDFLEISSVGNVRASSLASQVLTGVSALHGQRFVHRDLKPQNILVDDEGFALIGDFGSVKKLPEGIDEVPGSGHALLYRPPESISSRKYGISGDIYQVGIILYQLLGGHLPYDPRAWLSQKQLREYDAIGGEIDKDIYASRCLQDRIRRGKVLDLESLPPWVPTCLRRTISKACNIDPDRRFATAATFLAHLHSLRNVIKNWQVIDGLPVLQADVSYRLCPARKANDYFVEKQKGSGWRKDNRFSIAPLASQVKAIERLVDSA